MPLDERSRGWDDPDAPRDRRFLKAAGAGAGAMLLFSVLALLNVLPISSYNAGGIVARGLAALVVMLIALAVVKRPIPFWGHCVIFVGIWLLVVAI